MQGLTLFKNLISSIFADLLKPDIFDAITLLLGPDLALQSKLNLSIQMPGDTTSVLDMHSDCNSGDTPFQYNIWIPLTNAFSTNSMFLLGEEESRSYYQSLSSDSNPFSLPPLEDAFVDIKFGSYLLFPPLYCMVMF